MSTHLKPRPPHHLPFELPDEDAVRTPEIPVPLANGIYNSQQQAFVLGQKVGVGGQGSVYDIAGQPALVAKIYHEAPTPEKAEKLLAMTKLGTAALYQIAAWPVDVLRDAPDGNVIGFVMNKIGQAEEVHFLHSPKSRLRKFPDASWSFLLHVAANIARAVAALHELGFVIGDVNPKNILVTKKATVYLLDCDSFQLVANGKTYRCEGGFPEYTPPELHGISFSDVDRNQEHDSFGLAVVIFQLLFLGRHPYSGRFAGAGEMPLEKAIREGRFAYGPDAAQRQMYPPPGTLPFEALPASLTNLLCRAFLQPARPHPHEWIAPLMQLVQSLQRCVMHSGHYFYEALTECPWCQIETRARIRLFNFNPTEARQYPSAFRLDEIWAAVEKLLLPDRQEPPSTTLPQLSPAVVEYAKEMRVRYWLGIILAGLGGIFSASVGGFCASFWLLPITLLAVRWIAGIRNQREDKSMQTLFTAQFDLPNRPLAKKIAQERKKAEDSIREIEQKLGGPKEREAYVSQVNELATKLETYQTLTESDHRKFQLEHEITSTTVHLRQLKQRIEAKQQQLLPALTKAKQAVAEADKNLEAMSWRHSSRAITLLLIATFVLTLLFASDSRFYLGAMTPDFDPYVEYQPPSQSDSSGLAPNVEAPIRDFIKEHYEKGKSHFGRGEFSAANLEFLTAENALSEEDWREPYVYRYYACLYYDRCHTLVMLNQAAPNIAYLEKTLHANPGLSTERLRLAIFYSLVGRDADAAEQYRSLSGWNKTMAESLKQVLRDHGVSLLSPISRQE